MFASFEENSKTQYGDREGGEPFLLSNATGFHGCHEVSPSQPIMAVSSHSAEAPGGSREWGWGQRAAPENWSIATARGQSAAAQAGRGKGSSLPPPAPASSPAQPHIWRALR